MKRSIHSAFPVSGAIVLMSASLAWAAPQGMSHTGSGPMQARQVIQDWPESAQQAAQQMLKKYGEPDAVTSDMLVWENNGPWLRTIVHKREVQHNFPVPHKDVLQQTINYEVPEEKVVALVKFDGSLMPNRTSGELSAGCDQEATNILALNLAHDIVEGKRSVEEAREYAARVMQEAKQGQEPAYAQELKFETRMASAADPDEPVQVQVASGQSGSGRSGPGAAAGMAAGAAGAAAGTAGETTDKVAGATGEATDKVAGATGEASDKVAGATGETTRKVPGATGETDRGEGPAMTASDISGKTVVSAEGEEVGEVAGIVMNEDGEQLARVRLDGGFLGIGATEIVLPVSELSTTAEGQLRSEMTREKLRSLKKSSQSEGESGESHEY